MLVSMEMLELLRLWLVVEDLRDPPLMVSLDELVKLEVLPLRDDLLMLDPEPMLLRPLTLLLDESSDIVRSLLLEPEMLRPLVLLLLLMLEALVTLVEILKLALVTLDELVRLDGLDDLDGLDALDGLDDPDTLAADLRLLVGLKGGLAPSLCS